MTVFSKMLLGKLHIKAYDLVNPNITVNSTPHTQPKLASLKTDSVFTAPCNTSVLYPTSGGNIHSFRAITPCAILEVMLEEIKMPKESEMDRIEYLGLKITEVRL
ncbi:plant cysteine oxidase 2-like protein [Tanacetum coccineum]